MKAESTSCLKNGKGSVVSPRIVPLQSATVRWYTDNSEPQRADEAR
ncbi:hypothetical protein SAMN05216308_1176 [Nitrosospira sp. Nsp13]|jgi:hypothetical protein|nr:hypothetical protein SAMN05216308_1176 [Nitrosospira sp. Nsp13]